MDDVRKRSRWRTCRPRDGSVTAVSQVMGTAPQAIAGSAILRHMPRRMRRGHRRYSMRSGLIPPMRPRAPTAWPRLRRSSKPHQPCRGAWRRHRSAATRQSNVRCPESAKPAPHRPRRPRNYRRSPARRNPMPTVRNHHDSSLSPLSHHFRHAARMSTPAPIIAQMFDCFC